MNKKVFAAVTGLMVSISGVGMVEAAPEIPADWNAGTQLNRTLDYLQKEMEARRIEEGREKSKNKIQADKRQQADEQGTVATVALKKIVTDPSKVLTEAELKEICGAYENKDVTIKQLYEIVDKINALYSKKGYLTCRAFLTQQTIADGTVKITLIEGTTGNVEVVGNKFTKAKYINNRVRLARGEIVNVNELNKDLLWFNATNDVQLRIVMQAGKEPGTTDYVLQAYEPKKDSINVFIDNNGNESSGQYRFGTFYTVKSLSGNRDALTVGTIFSKGTKAVSSMYNRSIGHSGTKLNAQYSSNSVHVVKGDAADLGVKSHSNSFGIGVVQPWIVNEKTRSEATFDYGRQNSKTDFGTNSSLRNLYVDDTVNDATLGFNMTNYGKSHIFYQKHNLVWGGGKSMIKNDDTGREYDTKNYFYYKGLGLYQKAYQHGQSILVKTEVQRSSNDYVPSSRDFYIGGAYSVRGYKENYTGSDSGLSFSAEYAVPIVKDRTASAFTFFDYGHTYGEGAQSDNARHVLASAGIGVKATIAKKYFASVTLGCPLRRDWEINKPSKTRIHFNVSGQF